VGLDGIKSRPVDDLGYFVLDDFRGGFALANFPVEFVEAANACVGFAG